VTPHIVDLPWSKSLVTRFSSGQDGLMLQPEVKEWLVNHVGQGKFAFNPKWVPGPGKVVFGGSWALEFIFWEPKHAMMFKLAWQ